MTTKPFDISQTPLRGTRVIVAGAGLAGLTAAWALHARGAEVRVFEARERVGGRVHTIRAPLQEGQHGEAGGELIEEGHDAVRRLAARFGLRLVPVLEGGFGLVCQARGRVRRKASQAAEWKRLTAALAPLLRLWHTAGRRWDGEIAHALAGVSIVDALRDAGADDDVRAVATALRGLFTEDADRLSVLVLLEMLGDDESPAARRLFRIQDGNDRLTDALSRELAGSIHLGQPVLAVSQTAAGVTVTTRDFLRAASDARGDFVVLALPAPIVCDLTFDPPLPDLNRRAYQQLPFGRATKTLLQFDRPLWRRGGRRAWATDLPVGAAWDGGDEQAPTGLLALLAGGTASAETQVLLDGKGPAGLVDRLPALGLRGHALIASHTTVWERDSCARGSYACFTTGYDPGLRAWLARPNGRICFAGEHTSWRYPGYMNGAVESGFRAAADIEWTVTGRVPPPLP